jgi:alkanesulfonate monooxygenase SsuD/methylene tetrahydromethanopterin reductase-like flavin-dependent oxidoreductase (luciferase family)
LDHGLIYGSPDTVCEKLEPLRDFGVGGVIIHFRLGSMPWEVAEHSLRLFAEKVAPQLGDSRSSEYMRRPGKID